MVREISVCSDFSYLICTAGTTVTAVEVTLAGNTTAAVGEPGVDRVAATHQIYVGITIGILSGAVLLLCCVIFCILRRNKHRIFSKHAVLKSPLSLAGRPPDLTDARLRLSPLVYSGSSRRRLQELQGTKLGQSIYDEPCRPGGQRSPLAGQAPGRQNKSCGMLCEYENFYRREPQRGENNFGSTPLFNILTIDQRPRAPPPTSFSTTSFKDRFYDYSTPLHIDTGRIASDSDISDTFYAASDILNVSAGWCRGCLQNSVVSAEAAAQQQHGELALLPAGEQGDPGPAPPLLGPGRVRPTAQYQPH